MGEVVGSVDVEGEQRIGNDAHRHAEGEHLGEVSAERADAVRRPEAGARGDGDHVGAVPPCVGHEHRATAHHEMGEW